LKGSNRVKKEMNTQENRELRKEVDALQRSVARLRKENDKLRLLYEEPEPVEVDPELAVAKCPKCRAVALGSIVTPAGKVVTTCTSCKQYRRVEPCP
jgi:hypothetical protein